MGLAIYFSLTGFEGSWPPDTSRLVTMRYSFINGGWGYFVFSCGAVMFGQQTADDCRESRAARAAIALWVLATAFFTVYVYVN